MSVEGSEAKDSFISRNVLIDIQSNDQISQKSENEQNRLYKKDIPKKSGFGGDGGGQAKVNILGDAVDIEKSVVVNKKLYTYIGKPHPEIIMLFDLLEKSGQRDSAFRIINYFNRKIDSLEDHFDKKWIFFGGRMKISLYEFLIYIFFIAIFIVYTIKMAELNQDIRVRSSQWKIQISGNQMWFAALFTFYGIMQIINYCYINLKSLLFLLFLFVVLVVVQIFLFLYDCGLLTGSSFALPAYDTILSRLYPVILYIHWFIFSLIYNWIKDSFKRSSAMFFGMGWCLLIPYFMCLEVLSYILLEQNYSTFVLINNILTLTIAPMIIIIVVTWILLHHRLFMLPLSHIATAIARIKDEIKNNFKRAVPIEDEEDDPQNKQMRSKWNRLKKWIVSNFYMISSITIGSIYIFCEIYLVYQLIHLFQSDTINYDNLGILIFQILIIPAFIVLGIIISVSNRQTWMTYTFFPLFVAALPLFAIIPLSSLIKDTSFGGNLSYVAIIALPTIVVYWLMLALFGIQRRFKFLLFISYTCIFFAFPIGFLIPLSYIDIDGLDKNTVYYVAGFIVAAGVGILLLYLVYFIVRKLYIAIVQRKTKEIVDLTALSYFNLKNMGFLVNSSGFIFGYTLICYVFYARPDTASNDDRGFIDAMLVNLPLLFLLINNALQTESLELINEDEKDNLDISSSQISKSQISTNNDFQEKQKKAKFQKKIIYAGIFVPLCVALPLYLISSSRQNSTRIFTIMVGFPISFIIYWFLLDIKNKSKKFQNFFTPFLVSICWCCLIFPMFIIAPIISSYIYSNGDDFVQFMRGIVAAVAIILICGVTSFSIFIFIIKNQLEKEKRKKFVVTQMLKTCIDNRVKSNINPLAVLYDYFDRIQENEERMKQLLQQYRKPLRYDTKKLKNNKDFEEQIIISKSAQTEKKKVVVQARSKWDVCLDYLFCRFGIQVDDLNKQKTEDDGDAQTIDQLTREVEKVEEIMDDYLPKQLKKGYLYGQQEQMKNGNLMNEEEVNLMAYVEKTREQKAIELFENDKLKVRSKHDLISSKTLKFRSYQLKKIQTTDMNKYKQQSILENQNTDHGILINNSELERGFFFHELYKDFANEDDNLPETLIYNDFLELCRLSGILQVDDDYASSIQQDEDYFRDRKGSIESDLQSDDDMDLEQLTQKELSQLYDTNATQFWKGGILSMSLENFSQAIIQLANKLSIKKESKTIPLKIRELLYDRMYVHLMINIPNFASNYRPDVRKFMRKEDIQRQMEGSPFLFTINLDKQIDSNKDDGILFDIKHRKGKHLLAMQKEQNLDYANFQLDYTKTTPQIKATEKEVQLVKAPKEDVSCFISMCRCLRTCCCVYPNRLIQYVNTKLNSIISRMTKPKINTNFGRKPQVKKAPNWDDMADNLVSSMVIAIKAYEENQKQAQNVKFNWNTNNIMTLFGKVSDFLTLYGVAFNNSIEWFPGYATHVDASAITSGGIFSNFVNVYWVCFTFGMIYFVIAIIASGYAEKGTLGKDENGDNANFKHRQFYLSKGVNFLGSSQFMFIMRTFIDTYICDWEKPAPWPLYRTTDVTCMSNQHLLMMGLGFLSLLAYYPLSTFIQPGIQFLDNTLDVKYDKSYIAVYIQAKLIVLGATSFFKSFSNKQLISMVSLSVTSFIGFGMAILTIKMQPCLIQILNPIEIGFLLCIGIINGIGLVILLTDQVLLGFIINIALHLLVIVAVALIVRKKMKMNVTEKKKIVLNHLPVIRRTGDKKKEQQKFQNEAAYLDSDQQKKNKALELQNISDGQGSVQQRSKKLDYESDSQFNNTDQILDKL